MTPERQKDEVHRMFIRQQELEAIQVERIFSGQQRGILVVRDDVSDFLDSLVSFSHPHPGFYPVDARYDLEGYIYTTRWKRIEPDISNDNTRFLPKPNPKFDYRIIKPDGKDVDYLENLPDLPVAELSHVRVDNIHAAIRQQAHILDAYTTHQSGSQLAQTHLIINFTEDLYRELLGRRTLSADELRALQDNVLKFINDSGLAKSLAQDKIELTRKLKASGRRVEGHPNYLITLTRIGAAHARAMQRESISAITASKFSTNHEALVFHRDQSELAIRLALSNLRILEMHLSNPNLSVDQIQLLQIISSTSHMLTIPKVRPYVNDTRYVSLRLQGENPNYSIQDGLTLGRIYARQIAQNNIAHLINHQHYPQAKAEINDCCAHLEYAIRDVK